MKKYILGAALSLGILVSPVFVQAAGLTGAQISSIISLLQAFGADSAAIANVQAVLNGTSTTQPVQAWCHTFNTNLGIGTRSAEIAALQTALSRSGNDTGTGSSDPAPLFNEQVAAAVTGFQEKYASAILTPNGLQHGTGYVGVSTRAKLNSLYGCSNSPVPVPTSTFSASPTSGNAPLNVYFIVPRPVEWPAAGTSWGGISYQTELYYGDGTSDFVIPGDCHACGGAHAYQSPGTYTAKLTKNNNYPNGLEVTIGQVTITVTASGTTPVAPVISGVSGPTSLQTGQQGTWTVKASDPANGTLTYSVVWGDETNQMGTGSMSGVPANAQTLQTATFTHTYSTAGNYQPTFFVTNNADVRGGSAQTSVSVNVGGATSQSLTVLSPNGGETWTKGTTQMITWQDNTPMTGECPAGANCSRAALLYDIQLAPYYAPCTSNICPMYAYRLPYTIANGVNGSSYNWSVGNVLDTYGSGNTTASDGPYTIQVCQTGTSICDSSDQPFTVGIYLGGV